MYGSVVEKKAKMWKVEIIGQVERLLRSRRFFKLARAWDLLNLSTKLAGPSMEERHGGSGN